MAKGLRFVAAGVTLVLSMSAGAADAERSSEAVMPFIVVEAAGKTMEQAVADLKRAILDNNYVFVRQQALDGGLVPESQESQDILIVFFCNFSMLDAALEVDKRVGIFLPCRVTLIREPDGVRMVVVNPKYISKMLGDTRLADICRRLATDYQAILSEASL